MEKLQQKLSMEKGIYGETATKNYQWEREFVEKSGQKIHGKGN